MTRTDTNVIDAYEKRIDELCRELNKYPDFFPSQELNEARKELRQTILELQNFKSKLINDTFINTNKWEDGRLIQCRCLDIIIIDHIVFQISEIKELGYNEGMDVYEYNASLKSCFFNENRSFDYNMYNNTKILKSIKQR